MKRILILICMALLLSSTALAGGSEYGIPVSVTFNDQYIEFANNPILTGGTTYLPVRVFCEALSANVEWIASTQTVMVYHGKDVISFDIGSTTAYLNGIPKKLGGSAKLVGSVTYLPVRFLVESLGGSVSWDENYYTVNISMKNKTLPSNLILARTYTNDEIYWLAKIISCESASEPLKGKIAVGNVVLNRVKSDEYPDTIYSVIFDKENGYQFQPVANGSINNEPVQEAYLAAKLCLEGVNVVEDCMYFLNPDKATSFWIVENRTFYTTIGEHDFYN
ncbi:MAG: cell wall hydrolase [Monoglobales bacterium]